jgi:2-oxo-hept-3-ene-1,7-dioate hydratase
MTPKDHHAAALALLDAEATRRQIGLLSLAYPGMTLDDAYAVQAELVALKRATGRTGIGWKIGLTSRAMQEQLKIDTPDSGVLFDDMLYADGATVPKNRFIQARVEAEIAFLMARDLSGAHVTRADVLAATAHVAPALEILDTRILRSDPATGKARIITDTVSDNAANAGIVLGAQRHTVHSFDLRWVLDDPVTGILWLVQRLAAYGQGLKAGDIVLSGSFVRAIEAPPGSRFHADFGAFGSASLSFE